MGSKALRPRLVDEGIELVLEMPPSDGDAMRRDSLAVEAVTDTQGALEHALDPRRKAVLVMIAPERGPLRQ